MVLRLSDGLTITQEIKLTFTVFHNEAEYETVLLGLRLAKQLSITILELRYDSQLVAS